MIIYIHRNYKLHILTRSIYKQKNNKIIITRSSVHGMNCSIVMTAIPFQSLTLNAAACSVSSVFIIEFNVRSCQEDEASINPRLFC